MVIVVPSHLFSQNIQVEYFNPKDTVTIKNRIISILNNPTYSVNKGKLQSIDKLVDITHKDSLDHFFVRNHPYYKTNDYLFKEGNFYYKFEITGPRVIDGPIEVDSLGNKNPTQILRLVYNRLYIFNANRELIQEIVIDYDW